MPAPPLSEIFAATAGVIADIIGGRNLDRALMPVPAPLRPAVQDTAYGVLRQYGRGDAFLARLIPKPLSETAVRALLLAALYRLEARPNDSHTTVDQAVSAVDSITESRFKPLVNGVLRNFLRQQEVLANSALNDDIAHWQHPRWWIDRIRAAYPGQWQQILASGNERPPMTLRINRRRTNSAADYLRRLADAGITGKVLDADAILLDKPVPVERLPGFAAGTVSVQDSGAQRAAQLLDAKPRMRVLDACAAPGGKTAHLLELVDVDMTALDVDPKRLARVKDNLARLGLSAELKGADCTLSGQWWNHQPFDRILADVPCSATGVVRRHPDIKWLRRETDTDGFGATQMRILDALWPLLAPGGKMLYCTCSLFPEENRDQVNAFVSRHEDALRLPTGNTQTELQLTPTAEQDGFYYALLQKNA